MCVGLLAAVQKQQHTRQMQSKFVCSAATVVTQQLFKIDFSRNRENHLIFRKQIRHSKTYKMTFAA